MEDIFVTIIIVIIGIVVMVPFAILAGSHMQESQNMINRANASIEHNKFRRETLTRDYVDGANDRIAAREKLNKR